MTAERIVQIDLHRPCEESTDRKKNYFCKVKKGVSEPAPNPSCQMKASMKDVKERSRGSLEEADGGWRTADEVSFFGFGGYELS